MNDDADVQVRIRHLRIDPALAERLSPVELQAAVQAAVADRLGSGFAPPRKIGVSDAVADAIVPHVKQGR